MITIEGTVGVEFEALSLKPFDILYFFIDFGLSLLDLSQVELFEIGGIHELIGI